MSGTTTGEIKVRLERESAAAIDSNNYNLGLPVSAEVIQGTGPSMFKIQITMSSGVKVVSNDFVFTTEAIGTDVYISSFTFKAGNQAGYLSADIGLNNGVVIEANNFLVPTDPNVTSAITDLQNRVSAVESTGVAGFNELKTTVEGHTTSINELNTEVGNLTSDVAGLTTDKADVNNSNQTIVAGTVNATNINKGSVPVATVNDIPDISGKVNISQGTENAGKVLGIGNDGNVTPVSVSSGEEWEEIDLENFPNNWVAGDRVRIYTTVCINDGGNVQGGLATNSEIKELIVTNKIWWGTVDGVNCQYTNGYEITVNLWNAKSSFLELSRFNAITNNKQTAIVNWNNFTENITMYKNHFKIWRLKQSTQSP